VPVFNHSSQLSYSVSFRNHKSGEDDSKTKTVTVTEDCTATDDFESSTSVVEVPSTQVTESLPTVTVTKKVTRVEWVSTKSLHKPKHTKHHWTETETVETVAPTTVESTETHTKHHKSKHHKSKHHKSKYHTKHSTEIIETTEVIEPPSSALSVSETSSEFEETPLPTSSHSVTRTPSLSVPQTSSESSVKEEVVVITTEEVKVVTTGYEEVVSTITLSGNDTRFSTLTKPTSTGSSFVVPSSLFSIFNPVETPEPEFPPNLWPYEFPTETSSVAPSSLSSIFNPLETPEPYDPFSEWTKEPPTESSSVAASSLYSYYNPHMTRETSEWFNPRMTPVSEVPSPHSFTEIFTETSSEEPMMPTVTSLIPVRGPTVFPPHSQVHSEVFSSFLKYNPSYTRSADTSEETSMPTFPPMTPDVGPQLWSTSITADNTTRTRSGHKTKEPPSIIPAKTPSSTSFTDIKFTITHGPKYPPTETNTDDAVETVFAANNNGDPKKKFDKYMKPDKAMSKRMSRWSKHHSHAEEKNWSRHTKYRISSLEEQMRYDEEKSKHNHKNTLDPPAATATPAADANDLLARDDDDEDPEFEYSKEMKKASKQYNKVKSKADRKYSRQHLKELKSSSKSRAKSIAKEQKEYEKSSKKAFKSRMKHQGDDYVVVETREEDAVAGTPVSVPAMATVTVGGGGLSGTISTSWRTKHATMTASVTDGY
jgi:hypothetical protein